MDNESVKINRSSDSEVIEVFLSERTTPIAFRNKLNELMEQGAFETEKEAKDFIETNPFELELYYQKDCGLFGLDPEAVASSTCYSPYTGTEMVPVNEADKKAWFKDSFKLIDRVIEDFYGKLWTAEIKGDRIIKTEKGYDSLFYLSQIDHFKKDGFNYYRFLYRTESGEYAYLNINIDGTFRQNYDYEAKEQLEKIYGYEADAEEVLTDVRITLHDELKCKMQNIGNILYEL